jgi:predicted transcriptional regulator
MLEKISEISAKLEYGDFTCFDCIRCIFNLNETDIRVLQSFSGKNGKTVIEITKILNKDRSTIHRSLKKLVACKLSYKERKAGKSRGFIDYYYIIPEKEILKKAEEYLDRCYKNIKQMLRDVYKKKNKIN